MTPEDRVVNRSELAVLWGKGEKQIADWINAGMPAKKVGGRWQIDIAEATEWRIEKRLRDELGPAAPNGDADASDPIEEAEERKRLVLSLDRERAKEAEVKTRLLELKFLEETGALVNGDESQKRWARESASMKSHVMASTNRMRMDIPELTVDQIVAIREVLRRALTQVSEGDFDGATDDPERVIGSEDRDSEADDPPAEETDDQRVGG